MLEMLTQLINMRPRDLVKTEKVRYVVKDNTVSRKTEDVSVQSLKVLLFSGARN